MRTDSGFPVAFLFLLLTGVLSAAPFAAAAAPVQPGIPAPNPAVTKARAELTAGRAREAVTLADTTWSGDLELLLPACAAAHREELGIDPLERDPDGFRWRTRAQIDEGRSWIWAEDGVIRFKAEASAWTPRAVQLQQVWTDPEARGRGDASRGLRDLTRLLLRRVPVVCLFVRAENAVAIRLYERVGMRHTIDYRSVLL